MLGTQMSMFDRQRIIGLFFDVCRVLWFRHCHCSILRCLCCHVWASDCVTRPIAKGGLLPGSLHYYRAGAQIGGNEVETPFGAEE